MSNVANALTKHKGLFSLKLDPSNDYLKTIEVSFKEAPIEEIVVAVASLNKAIVSSVEAALNSGCCEFQSTLQVPGDVAGLLFSGESAKQKVRNSFLEYYSTELSYCIDN